MWRWSPNQRKSPRSSRRPPRRSARRCRNESDGGGGRARRRRARLPRGERLMPMIDVYAAAGTFRDPHPLARDLAAAVMRWEQVPDLPLFANNTAAFIHDMEAAAISNV